MEGVSEFLSADEIRDFTRKARRDAQAKVLEADGIPFRWRGRDLIVSRHHAREWLAGRSVTPTRRPNLGAVT